MQCVIYIICTLSMVINLFVSVCIAGDYERSQPLGKRPGPRTFPSFHRCTDAHFHSIFHFTDGPCCYKLDMFFDFYKSICLICPTNTFKIWWKWCPASKKNKNRNLLLSALQAFLSYTYKCITIYSIHIHTRCDIFTFSFTARYCGGHIMKEATTYARDAVSMHKNK